VFDALSRIQPDLIVADEAHKLKNRSSSRRKRFDAYMKEHPECRLVALSGTITNRSIKDFAFLSEYTLRKNSPVPGYYRELQEWAEAIDVPKTEHEEQRAPGALLLLCNEGEAVRSGFRRRLIETPGVVATSEGAIGTSLYLRASYPSDIPPEIGNALAELDSTWQIEDEELEEAAAVARVAKQIACGFYYVWDWPGGVKDTQWLEARADWHRNVRQFLQRRAKAGLDSPMLVANACKKALEDKATAKHMGDVMVESWLAWSAVKDRPKPPTVPVWISRFMLRHIRDWAAQTIVEGQKGIVWYEHLAIEEALRAEGAIPVFGGGQDAELLDCQDDVVAASILAHGTGKNLQRYSRALFISHPSNGARTEQAYGRIHRPGQEADEVIFDICVHTLALRESLEKATADARYVEETQGQKQKLLYATRLGL
jgi:hypothetical protein